MPSPVNLTPNDTLVPILGRCSTCFERVENVIWATNIIFSVLLFQLLRFLVFSDNFLEFTISSAQNILNKINAVLLVKFIVQDILTQFNHRWLIAYFLSYLRCEHIIRFHLDSFNCFYVCLSCDFAFIARWACEILNLQTSFSHHFVIKRISL